MKHIGIHSLGNGDKWHERKRVFDLSKERATSDIFLAMDGLDFERASKVADSMADIKEATEGATNLVPVGIITTSTGDKGGDVDPHTFAFRNQLAPAVVRALANIYQHHC
jgi:hypothetical protein